MSALGILTKSSESVLSMLADLNFEEKTRKYALLKVMNTMHLLYLLSKKQNLDKPRVA